MTVKTGNPQHIWSVANLSGEEYISVEVGTTNHNSSTHIEQAPQAEARRRSVITFPKTSYAFAALKAGEGQCLLRGRTRLSCLLREEIQTVESFSVSPVAPFPVGIAIRKGDPLLEDGDKENGCILYEAGR